jgi:hypothetical protein
LNIEIEDLKKVKLEKGDILVITFDPDEITEDELTSSQKICHEIFTGNKVIFVPKYMELSVFRVGIKK